jgi:hypothetical protein
LRSDFLSDGPIVRLIIQTILLVPSGVVWTDEGPNVSRLDPTRSVQVDAEHPAQSRKIVGLNPTKHSKTSAQSDLFVSSVACLHP